MPLISVVIPCYGEENSVRPLYDRLTAVFTEQLRSYSYELIFVDDLSPDGTRERLRELCAADPEHARAIFNARNFGFIRNVFASLRYGQGDATFLIFGDLQDPPELLPQMVAAWENGGKTILGQRTNHGYSPFKALLHGLYYRLMSRLGESEQLPRCNGFGLYDRSFIEVLRSIDDPEPYLGSILADLAVDLRLIPYTQQESLRGHSGINFMKSYDVAMMGITSSTKALMRAATFVGAALGTLSGLYALSVLIGKLLHPDAYPFGTAAILIGIFFIGGVQLFFTGILGEYLLSVNKRTQHRPLVIVGETLNMAVPQVTCPDIGKTGEKP
ncbi:MAG: glycosyltransferase family 2 protein [Succinivibrio sp.]|nr:glycosyltransferase family 2 protein [Succinivibrio sp.]